MSFPDHTVVLLFTSGLMSMLLCGELDQLVASAESSFPITSPFPITFESGELATRLLKLKQGEGGKGRRTGLSFLGDSFGPERM